MYARTEWISCTDQLTDRHELNKTPKKKVCAFSKYSRASTVANERNDLFWVWSAFKWKLHLDVAIVAYKSHCSMHCLYVNLQSKKFSTKQRLPIRSCHHYHFRISASFDGKWHLLMDYKDVYEVWLTLNGWIDVSQKVNIEIIPNKWEKRMSLNEVE